MFKYLSSNEKYLLGTISSTVLILGEIYDRYDWNWGVWEF